MEIFFNNFLDNYGTMIVVLMLVVATAVYVAKILKEVRRRKNYDAIAAKIGLNKLPAMQDLAVLYGDKVANIFPGFEKKVIARYDGLPSASLSGEFFCAAVRAKVIRTTYKYWHRAGVSAKDVEGIENTEYDVVLFKLGGKSIPEFNLNFEALVGSNSNSEQNEAYSKYFNNETLEIIRKIPGVSVCSTGNYLMFYLDAYSVKDMRQFIQNASKAAECIIR